MYEAGSLEGLEVRSGQKWGDVSLGPWLVGSQHTSAVGETEEWEPALKKPRDREPRDRNEMQGVTQSLASRGGSQVGKLRLQWVWDRSRRGN